MKTKTEAEWDDRCKELSRAWGNISHWRVVIRQTGATKAADALSRALKSLDGAIRHAQRMRYAAAEKGGN